MAKQLLTVVRPTPPKPLAEMSDEEYAAYMERLYDEQVAPALSDEQPQPPAS